MNPPVDAAVIVRLTLVFAVKLPEVPVTEIFTDPVDAVLVVVSVRMLVVEVLAGLNDAVTPEGNPVAARLTGLEKPLAGTTEIVLWPFAPCCTLTLAGEAESVKLGGGGGEPEEAPLHPAMASNDESITNSETALASQIREERILAGLAPLVKL